MNLQELKKQSPADLITQAEKLGIENPSTLRKQEILFAILKKLAEKISKYNNRHTFHKVFISQKWLVLNLIGSKRDPLESIAEQIDLTIKEQWISKGIPAPLKTKTKKTVAGVIKSLNNLME